MADLKYNFVDNNFTTYESVKEPEVKIPVIGDLVDISPWASGIAYSSSGESVPIAKNNISTPKMIDDNNPEQEIVQTSSKSTTTMNTTINKDIKGDKKYAFDFFYNKLYNLNKHKKDAESLSRIQAAGIVGNLLQESGLRTRIKGDGGKAFGIAQWHPDRQKGLKALANSRGVDITDLDTQLEYVWQEMNSTHKKALNSILNSNTLEGSTIAFMKDFEKPGNPKLELRLDYARSFLS